MSDFLTRLSRAAIGEQPVAVRPVVAPLFAQGPRLAGEPLDIAVSQESVAPPPVSPSRRDAPADTSATTSRRAHDDSSAAPSPRRARDTKASDASEQRQPARRRDAATPASASPERQATPQMPRQEGVTPVERRVVHESTTRERHVVHAIEVRRESPRVERVDRGTPTQRAEPRAATRQAETRAAAQPAPVEVRIGRIEVRVGDAPAAPQPRTPAGPGAPKLSLDDYLRSRDGAAR